MIRNKLSLIIAVMFFIGFCPQAQALVIVDTGTPSESFPSPSLFSSQWLSAEFDMVQADTITDVYGWIYPSIPDPSSLTLTASIYGDGGSIPDKNNQLFSTVFSAGPSAGADWRGASGLNWGLPSGTYWAAFEVRENDNFSGYMPTPSPNPLAEEAIMSSGGNWTPYTTGYGGLGIKILGRGSVVPEPATMLLWGLGIAGAALARRKRQLSWH